jgi:hypothetical protein
MEQIPGLSPVVLPYFNDMETAASYTFPILPILCPILFAASLLCTRKGVSAVP